MKLPRFTKITQEFPSSYIKDIRSHINALLTSCLKSVPKGSNIAVGIGSRGIGEIFTITKAVVDTLKERGFQPFIISAMGSHGGASPNGQRAILSSLNITEKSLGVSINTNVDSIQIGTNSINEPVYFDKVALNSNGIILINRIKPHTSFTSKTESGILKMLAVGLGNQKGAMHIHQLGSFGLKKSLSCTAEYLLNKVPFICGLGIIENAYNKPYKIEILNKENIFDKEEALLNEARCHLKSLPFDELDVLIVVQIGKNFSGTGMDPFVIGRRYIETEQDFKKPKITRIAALDLSSESKGNAVGVGFADLITKKLFSKINHDALNANVMTSNFLCRARIPIVLLSDKDVIEKAFKTCWVSNPENAKAAIILNTLELNRMWISSMALKYIKGVNVKTSGILFELPFKGDDLDISVMDKYET